jgi:hypothetical protein
MRGNSTSPPHAWQHLKFDVGKMDHHGATGSYWLEWRCSLETPRKRLSLQLMHSMAVTVTTDDDPEATTATQHMFFNPG